MGGSLYPPFRKIKRYLFPLNEFAFGINIKANSKARGIRNFLGVTVTLSVILGILVNIITNFIV